MIIKNAMVFTERGGFKTKDICMRDGLFIDSEMSAADPDEEVIEADGLYAVPGLTDLHFHGCVGYDFCDGTHEAFRAIADYEAANGITSIVPATMTFSEEKLTEICSAAASYKSETGAILCLSLIHI